MKPNRFLMWMSSALFGVLLMLVSSSLANGQSSTPSFLREHAILGAALHIAVEAPGKIWFTMPAANAIGSLVVSPTVTVTQYTVPTANSQPYDLAYANGAIWFTERGGHKLGQLNVETGAIQEYSIPTAGSSPTGIGVSAGGYIWYTASGSNQIGRFNPTTNTFDEYTFGTPNAQFEDIAVVSDDVVWATAPNLDQVVFLDRLDQPDLFSPLDTAPYEGPTNIVLDEAGLRAPWVTLRDSGFILRYAPGTLGLWRPYLISTPESGPTGIAFRNNGSSWELWFAQNASGKGGLLNVRTSTTPISIRDQSLPGSSPQPWGVAVDSGGTAWFATGAANTIVEWQPPYFWFAHLPLVDR